jgi:hypothetical protein
MGRPAGCAAGARIAVRSVNVSPWQATRSLFPRSPWTGRGMGDARRRLLGVSEYRFQLRRSGFQTMDHGVGLVPRPICLGLGYAKAGGDKTSFAALAEARPDRWAMSGGTMAGSVSSASHAAASVSVSRVMGHKSWGGSRGGERCAVRSGARFGVPRRSGGHAVRRVTPFGRPRGYALANARSCGSSRGAWISFPFRQSGEAPLGGLWRCWRRRRTA